MLILLRGLVVIGLVVLWVYGIVDVLSTRGRRPQNLPKWAWLPIVFLVPVLGSLAWLLLGRPEGGGWRPGDASYSAPAPAPEDSPEFIERLRSEIRRRKLRDELRRLKSRDDAPPPGSDDPGGPRGAAPDDPDPQ